MSTSYRYVLLITRILFGLFFLWSGVDKLFSDFSATPYLNNVVSGPFASFFSSMAENQYVSWLVIWGEILIGLGIFTGTLVRLASFWGCIMMFLFYFSAFSPSNSYITQHIIYILVFALLSAGGAGRFIGIDGTLERIIARNKPSKLRYILG